MEWGPLRAVGCIVWKAGLGKGLRATEIGESVGWPEKDPVAEGVGGDPGWGRVVHRVTRHTLTALTVHRLVEEPCICS